MTQMVADAILRKDFRRADRMITKTSQAFINTQIGQCWLDLEQHCAWHGEYILDQVVSRRGDDGWTIVIKAYRGKFAWVAFIEARTLSEAYDLAGEFAKKGVLVWSKDKWPSRRVKRLLGLF